MKRDEAESLLNDMGEWEAHRVVCLKNGWTEKAKEASDHKAEILEKLLAALTNEQRKNCIDIGGGHGLCDMCASGRTDLCRYVNTVGALKEIDELRAKLAALAPKTNQPVDLHKEIMNIPVDEDKIVKHLADETNLQRAYKIGHRDARHAAAEIVAGH